MSKYLVLRVLLFLSLIDACSVWLIMLLYLTGIDLIYLVNVNFLIMFSIIIVHVFFIRRFSLILIIGLFLLLSISFAKIVFFLDSNSNFNIKEFITYNYGIMMPIFTLRFTELFSLEDKELVLFYFQKFSRVFLFLISLSITIYFGLYLAGKIRYFGLATNLNYSYPFFLNTASAKYTVIFFSLVIITGKRGTMFVLFSQFFAYYLGWIRRRPFFVCSMLVLVFSSLYMIFEYTVLFDRYRIYLDLDFNDPYKLLVAFSGRFEELIGIHEYFSQHPSQILLGAPAGDSYLWNVGDHSEMKSYAHVMFFGVFFRYGLIAALTLYGFFIYLIIKCWDVSNPFFLATLGVIFSTFFGTNLMIDPIPWLFIGFLRRF